MSDDPKKNVVVDGFFQFLEEIIPNQNVDAFLEFLRPIVGNVVDIWQYIVNNKPPAGADPTDEETQLALDLIRAAKDAEAKKEIEGQ